MTFCILYYLFLHLRVVYSNETYNSHSIRKSLVDWSNGFQSNAECKKKIILEIN